MTSAQTLPKVRADGPVLLGAERAANPPAHQSVYDDLRARILFGDYAPGQALTIQGLVRDTGAGMTPVREAIRRLTSEGAVGMLGNRRLELPVLSRRDIDELSFLRNQIEPELARRATPFATPERIRTLTAIDTDLDGAIHRGDVVGYLRLNHAFHRALYEFADAPILLETVERLWLRFGPSMRVICGRLGTQSLPDQHVEILTALEMGDCEAVAYAMRADVTQGMQQIAQSADSIDGG